VRVSWLYSLRMRLFWLSADSRTPGALPADPNTGDPAPATCSETSQRLPSALRRVTLVGKVSMTSAWAVTGSISQTRVVVRDV